MKEKTRALVRSIIDADPPKQLPYPAVIKGPKPGGFFGIFRRRQTFIVPQDQKVEVKAALQMEAKADRAENPPFRTRLLGVVRARVEDTTLAVVQQAGVEVGKAAVAAVEGAGIELQGAAQDIGRGWMRSQLAKRSNGSLGTGFVVVEPQSEKSD